MFEDEENEHQKTETLPIYKKGREIIDLVRQIADLIPDDGSQLASIKHDMLQDAYMLCAKIANAEGGDMYDLRMENAAIIRKSAHSLMIQYHSLEMFGFEHVEYFLMVRKQIEEFRLLFIPWVASFDKQNYRIDRWGLFNPPGIGPFDVDIDEGLGRNIDFFDEEDEEDED